MVVQVVAVLLPKTVFQALLGLELLVKVTLEGLLVAEVELEIILVAVAVAVAVL
jgi:hypothetical protein